LQLFVGTLSCFKAGVSFDPVASNSSVCTTWWSCSFPSAGSGGWFSWLAEVCSVLCELSYRENTALPKTL